MSGIEAAGLALGMISSIIAIIKATHQVYEAVKDEAGLPANFKKSASKLPLVLKLLEDADRYAKSADEATKTAFASTLEDCKAQAIQLERLFEKLAPEGVDSRWDRYVKAARTIGKGGRAEDLVEGILGGLQLLTMRFPEATTARSKDQLAKAVEEVASIGSSLPNGFEQIPSYASHGNIHFTVPRASNSLFTGRTELLSRMQTVIRDDNKSAKQKRFVITGLGGQGKSEICLQIANMMKDEFWGIFWIDVDSPSTAERDFIATAKLLGVPAETVLEVLQALATIRQSWLLILDNADDPDFDYQKYFPPGDCGAVLMTSRVTECTRYSPNAFQALDGLEREESKHLLLKAAEVHPESWLASDSKAEEVVNLLGSHTLALIQAGAYIGRGFCELHEYPDIFRRQRQLLLKFRPTQAQSRYRDVYTTFEASAERLKQADSQAAQDALDLLAILSVLGPAFLPLQIFESAWTGSKAVRDSAWGEQKELHVGSQSHVEQLPNFMVSAGDKWDSRRLKEATFQLFSLSLVKRHSSPLGVSMHVLAHAWSKDRLSRTEQGAAWVTAGCVFVNSRSELCNWTISRESLAPHIVKFLDVDFATILTFGAEFTVMPIILYCFLALVEMQSYSDANRAIRRTFANLGKDSEMLLLIEQCIKSHEATNPAQSLEMRHGVAVVYQIIGSSKRAVEILEDIVKTEELLLVVEDPSRLESMHALGLAYDTNGEPQRAIDILKQVIDIRNMTSAPDDRDLLETQDALARILDRTSVQKE